MHHLTDIFHYDIESGKLLWKVGKHGRGCVKGKEAGSVKTDGRYRTVFFNGKRLYCHRVIWEIINGEIPQGLCIDHIDGNGLNNKIDNLRLVTLSENQKNRRLNKNNSSGIAGVFNHRGGFSVYCDNKYVAWVKDFFEACCIRKSAELVTNYHPNNGRI